MPPPRGIGDKHRGEEEKIKRRPTIRGSIYGLGKGGKKKGRGGEIGGLVPFTV